MLRKYVQPDMGNPEQQSLQGAQEAMRRQLRTIGGLMPEQTISATIPAVGSATVVHRLGRVPKGWAIESCDLGGPITCTARTRDTITLANAHATDVATLTVRVY